MSDDTLEQYKDTLNLLNEDTIEKLYLIWVSEKLSVATLRKLMIKEKLLKEGIGKRQMTKTANRLKIDRSTIWRTLNKEKNKSKELN